MRGRSQSQLFVVEHNFIFYDRVRSVTEAACAAHSIVVSFQEMSVCLEDACRVLRATACLEEYQPICEKTTTIDV